MPDTLAPDPCADPRNAFWLLRDVLGMLEEEVYLLDALGRILDANRAAGEAWDRDVVGRSCRDLEQCEVHRPTGGRCPLQETLDTGRPAEADYARVDAQGRMRHYRVRTVPVPHGSPAYVVRVRKDMTGRRLMEQKLLQSEKMAAIGELSTYLAHEIRNPLFAIAGFANSLLRSKALDDSAREKAEIIGRESRRLEDILRSILNFARPTDPAPGETDVNRVASETAAFMRLGCDENVGMDLDLAPNLPRARGAPDLLKQCLVNLVKNGLEAMPDGGRLTLRTILAEDMVALSVQDTGRGIPPEHMDKIFNPFFSTKDQGAGLGLAMTRKIVEQAGGRVRLASIVDRGTTVTLLLPPVLAAEDAA